MGSMSCEMVRDTLPALVATTLPAEPRRRLEEHLADCAACRAELALVTAVRSDRAKVPPGLHARVVTAVQRRRSPRRWAPTHLAVAASVALLLLTGALVARVLQTTPPSIRGATPAPAVATANAAPAVYGEDVPATSLIGWTSGGDPLLNGTPTLHELSVDELETLLAELES